jgi:hypothetical protein
MQIEDYESQAFEYNIPRPGGGVFRTNIDLLGKTINKMRFGYSIIIVIVGGQRTGKSHFGVWLAWRIHSYFFPDVPFDVSKFTFYDPVDSIGKVGEYDHEPIIIDEAGAVLNKQEWYEKVSLAMNKIIQTQAYKCNCYIFISPFGNDIAKAFRKHFDFLVFVTSRGNIIVKKIIKKYDEINDVKIKMHFYEKIRIYKKDVPAEIWAQYDAFSKNQKEKLRKEQGGIARQAGPKDFFGRRI